ncbi:hypothetical protein ACIQ1J_12890 [Streptomyces sp. NPDC097107]|uniref:hypothetical protein n=1 Tax=Streptomyces sp. NPDC097107 TaxID=3366089 RepID=UPI0038175B45
MTPAVRSGLAVLLTAPVALTPGAAVIAWTAAGRGRGGRLLRGCGERRGWAGWGG